MRATLVFLVVACPFALSACRCKQRPEDPRVPDERTGKDAMARGLWYPIEDGQGILDLRIGDGPTTNQRGDVRIWVREDTFQIGTAHEHRPEIEARDVAFPWSTGFFDRVEYDGDLDALTIYVEVDVGERTYAAEAWVSTAQAQPLLEFLWPTRELRYTQPVLTGTTGFEDDGLGDLYFDLDSDDRWFLKVENHDLVNDPPFRHVWVWRLDGEPGWPTPDADDAVHDDGFERTNSRQWDDDFTHQDREHMADSSEFYLYAMVEFVEDGLTKYWQYRTTSPRTASSASGYTESLEMERKDNPTGVGPSSPSEL